jgi:hypothetical protein
MTTLNIFQPFLSYELNYGYKLNASIEHVATHFVDPNTSAQLQFLLLK